MHVIGTAGHIDHGKSTLIRALTGYDPDRLKEEQERGMTIDLGFTFLVLPSGKEVGIVDVPGHHRFVRNMLAGASGVDLVLFVVAATEGWMPQTQEHLDILNLLSISKGIIVLTKADLVDDEWMGLVVEDVEERLEGTFLEGAPMVQVAAPSGIGIDELKQTIDEALLDVAEPVDQGRPRLWIDRVFTVRGSGTVVTGTLLGGSVAIDDALSVVPSGDLVRVRGMQLHNKSMQQAPVGGRVAFNIVGMEQELSRGDALVGPEFAAAHRYVDVLLYGVSGMERPLPREAEMKFYIGTAERIARIKLLDSEELAPGGRALAQIELDRPCAAEWHDRFVIRDPAHHMTTGGGIVLNPHARPVRGVRHRFHRDDYSEAHRVLVGVHVAETLDLELLASRQYPSEEQLVQTILKERGWIERDALHRLVPTDGAGLAQAVGAVTEKGVAFQLSSYIVEQKAWARLKERVEHLLAAYHREFPLRAAAPRETLRSHLGVDWRFFDEMMHRLEQEGLIKTEGARVRLSTHRVTLTNEMKQRTDRLLEKLRAEPFAPPSLDELLQEDVVDEELVGALAEQGTIVKVGTQFIFPTQIFHDIQKRVVDFIEREGRIDVAALRDLLGTTRKYALPLLEHFDQVDVTKRVGDVRILGAKAKEQSSPKSDEISG